ncbi:MAG TPA: YidB family protein [Hyphomicrobiaceae bacterium]|nr:YidB family protein [Hyphomicrobiaceae bacterium]
MGLLDDVIGAALGSKSGSGQASPIMLALMALLASRAAAGAQQPGSLGGLGGLLDQFRQNGLEDIMKSWIGTGQNQPISPNQLHQALGQDTVNDLAEQTGLPHDDLLAQLSRILPGVVDKLTPNGELPSDPDLLPGPR